MPPSFFSLATLMTNGWLVRKGKVTLAYHSCKDALKSRIQQLGSISQTLQPTKFIIRFIFCRPYKVEFQIIISVNNLNAKLMKQYWKTDPPSSMLIPNTNNSNVTRLSLKFAFHDKCAVALSKNSTRIITINNGFLWVEL